MTDDWRIVPGCPAREVNSSGELRDAATKDPRKATKTATGYRVFCAGGVRMFLHNAVMLAFVGPKPESPSGRRTWVTNHKDGNPDNNCLSNLEYTTQAANLLHGRMLRRGKVAPGTTAAEAGAIREREQFLRERCTVCLSKGHVPTTPAKWFQVCSRCNFIARRCNTHGGPKRRHDGYRLGAWHDLLDHMDNHCAAYAELRRTRDERRILGRMQRAARQAAGALLLGVAPL